MLTTIDSKQITTGLVIVLLVTLCLEGSVDATQTSREVTMLLNGLRKTCYRCHGESNEAGTTVEGEFDLSPVLQKDHLSIDDSATWLRVLREVNTKRMPPESRDLPEAARVFVDRVLNSSLNSRNLTPRMLTSPEIDNDHSLIYNYHRQNLYTPFDTLKLQKLSDSRYRTVDSTKLMSADFLGSYQQGLEKLIDDYTQSRHEINAKRRVIGEPALVKVGDVGDIASAVALDKLEKGSSHFEMRCWGWQKLSFRWAHPGKGMPPGKYRITFKAKALNRHKIAEKKAELEAGTKGRDQTALKKLMSEWRPLLYSKARISLHGEVESSHRKSKVLTTITEIEIDDREEKTYTYDFTLQTGGWIFINFINGPSESARWKTIRFGSRPVGRDPDYPYPKVQVRDMYVTQIGHGDTRNDYDVAYLSQAEFNRSAALQKVQQYAIDLGVPGEARLAKTLFERLPATFELPNRYAETLKLLSMSNAYLFIDCNAGEKETTRYASYALLKRNPSQEFAMKFAAFRMGKVRSDALAKSITSAAEFKWFLREFVKGWFMDDVDLDVEKYSRRKRLLDVSHEPVDYLHYIFVNNRPIREVFQSDYSVADAVVAPFYEIAGAQPGQGQVHKGADGGILRQVAFLKSQSDGIDGLPFRRSKWILENVFNERLGNPPNNVNNDEFVASTEVTTFKQRTELHAKQRGCVECHKAIDPVAFAVQHLGALGENVAETETDYVGQLQERLAKTEQAQVRAFATQLIQYVAGRRTTIYDQQVIDRFIQTHDRNGYRAQALLAHLLEHYFSRS